MNKLEKERGITLIALIITIIILVILAAVSIRAVTNMKIVDYAVNGSQNYAKAGKAENKVLDDTVSFIDEAVEKVNKAINGTDYSDEILAKLNSYYENCSDDNIGELVLDDGTKLIYLGPKLMSDSEYSSNTWHLYYSCDGKVYKATRQADFDDNGDLNIEITEISKTNINAEKLGYNGTTLTTVNGVYQSNEIEINTSWFEFPIYIMFYGIYQYEYKADGSCVAVFPCY